MSTAIFALYPNSCLQISALLSLSASISGLFSNFYLMLPSSYQGCWVCGGAAAIFFCSGSSISRALVVTAPSREQVNVMSNVYTCSKISVFLVSFLLSLVLNRGCWHRFGYWVFSAYGLIFVGCLGIFFVRDKNLSVSEHSSAFGS